MQRIRILQQLAAGQAKAYSRYLRETIKPCLERLEHVRDSQLSTSFPLYGKPRRAGRPADPA